MPKSAIDLWANFLFNEKFTPETMESRDVEQLIALCQRLAEIRPPCIKTHKDKLESRRLVCETAIDTGIDLVAMNRLRHGGGKKVAMGRGLLDMWREVYKKRFGSTYGTNIETELRRRNIVTNLSKELKKEEE